jgi:hypothetical protein
MPFDLPFIGLFLATTLVVVGLFARAILRLLSFRDPTPPTQAEQS